MNELRVSLGHEISRLSDSEILRISGDKDARKKVCVFSIKISLAILIIYAL